LALPPSWPPFVESEYGPLREVALCEPVYFDWAAENAIVAQSISMGAKADRQAAMAQHRELVMALEEAGVTCRFLAPDPHLPMQTFTRDSGIVTPWGMLVAQMARPERRGEWAAVVDLAASAGIPVWRKVTAGMLEGGDVQILRPGTIVIGVNEVRTSVAAAKQVAAWFTAEGWDVRLVRVPAHFLHLDVLFSVAGEGIAACATDILDEADVAWFRSHFDLVPIGYRDIMRMSCNITALGNGKVLSCRQNGDLNARLRSHGMTVYDPDLEQFVLEGGATHCLTMPLKRDPVRS